MKTFLCFLFILLLSGCSLNKKPIQQAPIVSVITTHAELLKTETHPHFLSNYARIFLHTLSSESAICDIRKNFIPSNKLMNNFPISIIHDSIFCITGFLEVSSSFEVDKLTKVGVEFQENDNLFSTVFIPLYALCDFLKTEGIIRFELARQAILHLNVARPAVNAQIILEPINPENPVLHGEGVIVGIVDYGFDYTHPDFYDQKGVRYRISKVWEQTKKGNPPPGFIYGRELTGKEEITTAQTDTPRETHGTHVAGIAVGGGYSTEYYGLAPAAEIVLVSTNRTDAGIADGLKYIAEYAASQQKPCVINFSLGSSIGPHDGTSSFDRLCDKTVRPGLLLTGSVGNSGNLPVYLPCQFKNGVKTDTLISSALIPDKGSVQLSADIWGEVGTTFAASISLTDTTSMTEIGNTPFVISGSNRVSSFQIFKDSTLAVIQMASETGEINHKPTILVQINIPESLPKSVIPVLHITSKQNTSTSTWLAGGIFSSLGKPEFTAGNTSHTAEEIGGTGNSIISVGAFCTKPEWNSTDGNPYNYGPSAITGEIAYFSSQGPTTDGRIKPDICCPGYGVVSAFSRFFDGAYPPDYYRTDKLFFGHEIYYMGISQGTSESAPIMAGALALWLQKKPNLTIEQAKEIIRHSAIPPRTPPIPNNTWGWGILNAARGIEMLH